MDQEARPTSSIHRLRTPSRLAVAAALLTVYVVWGSTYLGIAIAIESIPPFLMLAIRFGLAGAVLLGLEVVRGGSEFQWPSRRQWRDASIVGALLLGIGNGFVSWSEQTVPSGTAATLIALVPVWFAILSRIYFGERLPRLVTVGVVVGFAGVVMLVWPFGDGANHFAVAGIVALILAPIGWSHGSLFAARAADLPDRPLVNTAVQMLAGAAALLVEGIVTGEMGRFHPDAITGRSLFALLYLAVIGSMLAYNAYAWLLRNASISLVGTYAYVNPVVAVALGSVFLFEAVSPRTLVASGVIVAAVAMIVTARGRTSRTSRAPDETGTASGESPPTATPTTPPTETVAVATARARP